MARFLVQFDPAQMATVSLALQAPPFVPAVRFVYPKPVFDYLVLDLPPELVAQVDAVPGVLKVVPDKPMGILQEVLPVNQELALLANPLNALALALPRREVWPTGESRKMVGADIAEAEGITGKGVKVAVLDTGIDAVSYQLPMATGESFVTGEPWPYDNNGHHTHVASTIGGQPFRHPFGLLKGVAPGAELIHIKVLGYGLGFGNMSDILAGMQRAKELGAKIINMSLGGKDTDDPEAPEFRAVKQLTEAGIIVCIAVGNEGPKPGTVASPGSAPDALTVGAIDMRGNLASFSSRGPTKLNLVKPDVVAPGVNILSESAGLIAAYRAVDTLKAANISGSSMACPHCAGVVALAVELARRRGIELTTPMVKAALEAFGKPKDNETGWGLITYPLLKRFIEGS